MHVLCNKNLRYMYLPLIIAYISCHLEANIDPTSMPARQVVPAIRYHTVRRRVEFRGI